MAQVDIILPKMGESVFEATIIKWLKKEGDAVEADESIIEIATDKVDTEVPAPVSGVMGKLLFNEGDVVKVGSIISAIHTSGADESVAAPAAAVSVAAAPAAPSASHVPAAASAETIAANQGRFSDANRFYSPLVRNIASSEGISLAELEGIEGTGKDNRVSKNDLLDYLEKRKQKPATVADNGRAAAPAPAPQPAVFADSGDEIVEMDRMRRLISDHMVMSKRTSPHVTSFVEADVTNLVRWRERVKDGFEKRENEKLTFTPIFVEALAIAIREMPMVNVSVDGTRIIMRKNINIGMATALPSGNLIVPVIRNADHKSISGLTREVNDLARRARASKLKPEEIQGGTFTLTNVGVFGNLMGTPIINQPQVAILATGAIRKKPAVIETPEGDAIAIRHMMFLSLSYDHRVVDGSVGGRFVRRVADILEGFDVNRVV